MRERISEKEISWNPHVKWSWKSDLRQLLIEATDWKILSKTDTRQIYVWGANLKVDSKYEFHNGYPKERVVVDG